MRKIVSLLLASVAIVSGTAVAVRAADKPIIAVSWFKFADERWKIDEAGIKAGLAGSGMEYVSADAANSDEKQVSDIENLLTRHPKALIIMAGQATVGPQVKEALESGVPVIAYDQLIDQKGVFYVSFDAKQVGYALADGMLKYAPKGNYAILKGDKGDPNTLAMFGAFMQKMKPSMDSGSIKIVGEQFVDSWRPETAKTDMEQILTANHNKVDAVMVMNDGMASGVAKALQEQDLKIPISGQDGGGGALNRIARGEQTFTIWKNSKSLGEAAARVALDLIAHKPVKGMTTIVTPKGNKLDAVLLPVDLIDRNNLGDSIKVGWTTKAVVCAGVTANAPPLCK
jgi:D-xylose transport system substrate-binding protein